MKWQPTRFTTMREFDFTNILIGIVSLAGAVFIHVISPNFYRGTGIPEIMFVLVMIGIAVLLFRPPRRIPGLPREKRFRARDETYRENKVIHSG